MVVADALFVNLQGEEGKILGETDWYENILNALILGVRGELTYEGK